MRARGMLAELWKSAPGRLGAVLLAALGATAIVVAVTFPPDFGPKRWSNPALWADSPRAAPPVWTNLFRADKLVRHSQVRLTAPTRRTPTGAGTSLVYEMPVAFDFRHPPTFLSFSVSDVVFQSQPPVVSASLLRPDGALITLHRESIRGARPDETPPIRRLTDDPLRFVIEPEDSSLDQVVSLFHDRYGVDVDRTVVSDRFLSMLFGVPSKDGATAVIQDGTYTLRLEVLTADAADTAGSAQLVMGGSVSGALGTDGLGRDLAQGLLYGLPIALLIGISTAVVSTFIGMGLGLASGYFGGATDMIIQRSSDIVANVPLLPLLIFLVFIGGSKLWLILLILVLFSWPGLTIMVRTMVLQLRTGQEVEAAQALGASGARVIVRHILPHAASFVLAQLVFSAPSAILAEAGLSFLGLGDPTLPTWGQILEYGFRTGAVYLGYWWWVIPPGLAIVITAVTFMFLALGLEPVVDPRLRGRRLWRS
jgi:peptide/nickel transport system permease protein